jgi:hypothetical protein
VWDWQGNRDLATEGTEDTESFGNDRKMRLALSIHSRDFRVFLRDLADLGGKHSGMTAKRESASRVGI